MLRVLGLILLACLAGADNSCRQCTGSQLLVFSKEVLENDAINFFETRFNKCATGPDYEITSTSYSGCHCTDPDKVPPYKNCAQVGLTACTVYVFNLNVWRYCGNGGTVDFTKPSYCDGAICVTKDNLNLTCNRSVQCKSPCVCKDCGC